MKKIIILLICSVISISSVSCSPINTFKEKAEETKKAREEQLSGVNHRFLEIDMDGPGIIYVDKLTKIQYLYFGNGYGSSVTCLLNTDGTPLLYEGDLT